MTSPDWLDKPNLTGDLVLLRPFETDDAAEMTVILTDPEVQKLTGSFHTAADRGTGGPLTADPRDDARIGSWYATRATAADRLDLAVVDRPTGTLVGEVVLNDWDRENNSCNFRTLLGPAGRGRGLGTEATRMIVAHAFETLGLHRVSLDVFAFNPRARRVYEKVGFVVEGVAREAFRWEDTWIDEIWMSILDHEWARHRGFPDADWPAGPQIRAGSV